MKKSPTLILTMTLFSGLMSSCSKLPNPAGLIDEAISSFSLCDSKTEYRFNLSSVSNPLATFTASSIGGTSTVISSTCGTSTAGDQAQLPAEHEITRTDPDLKVKVGTAEILSLKISSNALSGTLSDSCKEGKRAIHTLESGQISGSPKELKLTVTTRIALTPCP
jgi:hypothetical protein